MATKEGSKEAQLREQRESVTAGPRLGLNAAGAIILPKKGKFYMAGKNALFPSLGGIAHKIKDDVRAVKPRYDVHPACEPSTFPEDGPFKGGISINLPYSSDEPAPQPVAADAPRCQLCVEGRQAWPDAPAKSGSRQQRAAATPKAPVAFTFLTFKPEEPMFHVNEFFKLWHGHISDGVGAERAQDLIPDDVRSRALEALLKTYDAPAEVYDIIFEKARPTRKAKAPAKTKEVVETPVETVVETVVETPTEPTPEPEQTVETPVVEAETEVAPEVVEGETVEVVETPVVEMPVEAVVEEGTEPTRTDEPKRDDFESLADYSAALRAYRGEADQPSA